MKRACWVLSANAMERLRGFDVSSEDSDGALEETEISSHKSEDDRVGPTPAPIARDRSVPANKSAQPQRVRGSERVLKKKSLHDRIAEFPGERLEIRDGALFCGFCREWQSEKKSSVIAHVKSKKHTASKEKAKAEKTREQSLAQALAKRMAGETLPTKQRAYRMKVVQSFLREGIPLSKVDGLRDLLESSAFRLASSGHLSEYIPVVRDEERDAVRREIFGRPVSLIFDGTTRLGEAIAIVLRFVDDNFKICQRLVRLKTVAKAVNAPELCQVINECVTGQYSIDGNLVLASMRDGASVNGAAVRGLSVLFPNMMDVVCFSHTLNNAGLRFHFPTLDEFGQLWISLFSHSARAKLAWKLLTGVAIKSYSETRWWSKWEMLNQLCTNFADVQPFLQANRDISPKTTDRLLLILEDEDDRISLELELAAMIDIGKHLVRATYALEGDGPLVLTTYEKLQAVTSAFAVAERPNLRAVAQRLAEKNRGMNAAALEAEAMQGAKPAINWFLQKFNLALGETVAAFKKARIFDPVVAQGLDITVNGVRQLRCFPFFTDDILDGLAEELPLYLAAIAGVSLETADDKLRWWSRQVGLPLWSSAFRKVLLVQPSSAASERVFSLLAANISDEQEACLEDYLEASIMLRYNRR